MLTRQRVPPPEVLFATTSRASIPAVEMSAKSDALKLIFVPATYRASSSGAAVEILSVPTKSCALKSLCGSCQSRWESFGRNVRESSKNLFRGTNSALIRSCAWKSTSHLTRKFSPGLRVVMFSTNPQPSSQQQGSKFCLRTISCESCCACEKVSCTIALTTVPNILNRAYFHSVSRACGLYTFLKNEYSTLAVQMHRRNNVRNRNRARGKPINGIQRNEVGAAR